MRQRRQDELGANVTLSLSEIKGGEGLTLIRGSNSRAGWCRFQRRQSRSQCSAPGVARGKPQRVTFILLALGIGTGTKGHRDFVGQKVETRRKVCVVLGVLEGTRPPAVGVVNEAVARVEVPRQQPQQAPLPHRAAALEHHHLCHPGRQGHPAGGGDGAAPRQKPTGKKNAHFFLRMKR